MKTINEPMNINVVVKLEKNDLESIIDNIVSPFYDKIKSDNSVSGFVNEGMLHGLKVKQCLFVSLFLTQDIKNLQKFMHSANMAHQKLNIDVKLILPYFFIWCDLIEKWLKDTKKIDPALLNNWRNKQHALIGNMFRLNEQMIHSIEATDRDRKDQGTKDVELILENSKNKKRISSVEFFETYTINTHLMNELVNLEAEVDDILLDHETITMTIINDIAKVFVAYSDFLEDTQEFLDLSYALKAMYELLTKVDLGLNDEQNNKRIHVLIEAMIMDLRIWRKSIFEDKKANDIHFLDASILSGVTQLDVLLTHTTNGGDNILLF